MQGQNSNEDLAERALGLESEGLIQKPGPAWAGICVTWGQVPSLGFLLLIHKMRGSPQTNQGWSYVGFFPRKALVPKGG